MANLQEEYDEAMFAFSTGDMDRAIPLLTDILSKDPAHFDAQLSLGMAYYRKGDYASAIREGLKAEQLNPKDQLVHTNLSLFYMKAGDKTKAEHHGLQARIASWRTTGEPQPNEELSMVKPEQTAPAPPVAFPDMPWKKKPQPKN
jgi:tetratricopeptide (TPR) repeat protein